MNELLADPVATFQAISDATRLRLLRLLIRQELNVQELVAILEMRQPKVSRHLGVLREAGWLTQRRDMRKTSTNGSSVFQSAGPARLMPILACCFSSPKAAAVNRSMPSSAVIRFIRFTFS